MKKLSLIVAVVVSGLGSAPATAPAAVAKGCGDPGDAWERRAPEQVGMDSVRLQEAMDWASTHNSFTVAVYRHGCLAGNSRLDAVTSGMEIDGWSMTKSVTSMLVGRAVTLGKFDIDQPIGHLYPEADAAHARITPRQLLTMSSGLQVNWGRDLSPQPDRVRDALSLPFDYKPGKEWQYHQSACTLLANALERAVGKDLQEFAQEELFGPIGIPRDAWTWDRDRAGNTEGWAHLHMESPAWARLGHLMLRGGSWDGKQLISPKYFRQALTPTDINNAYGLLFWLNGGGSYVLPDVEDPDEGSGRIVKSGPKDMFLMAGSGEQRVYVIPSRDLVIVRLGERGSREGDTRVSVWTGRGGEVDNELVRRVLLAVTDKGYKDPGAYPGSDVVLPPPDSGIVGEAQDVEEVAAGLGAGPNAPEGCTPLGCESDEESPDSQESDDDPAESVQRDAQDGVAGARKGVAT